MRKLFLLVSILVLFCTSLSSAQITGPKVGEIVGQMGTTWNERDGGTENTSMGYELQMNDFLQTGEDVMKMNEMLCSRRFRLTVLTETFD